MKQTPKTTFSTNWAECQQESYRNEQRTRFPHKLKTTCISPYTPRKIRSQNFKSLLLLSTTFLLQSLRIQFQVLFHLVSLQMYFQLILDKTLNSFQRKKNTAFIRMNHDKNTAFNSVEEGHTHKKSHFERNESKRSKQKNLQKKLLRMQCELYHSIIVFLDTVLCS